MHYLVTGHTGFKGSWLSLMLQMQGHTVSGISLEPLKKSLFNQAGLAKVFENDFRVDIRDSKNLTRAVNQIEPEVIIHLAAQPLVRESYKDPVGTFETNVLGTLNLLEATKELANLQATLIITTDKVYKNHNHLRGYVETDELGGDDPYSASKAAADIATQSWVKSFATSPVAIARAGNVIGGGDWAKDRLIPDLVEAFTSGRNPKVRFPNAIRPWQHVLDCLNGYQMLVDQMLVKNEGGEWNFGPQMAFKYTVAELIKKFGEIWGLESVTFEHTQGELLPESNFLLLDSTKSNNSLGWGDKLDFEESLKFTAHWYKNFANNEVLSLMESQIISFSARSILKQ